MPTTRPQRRAARVQAHATIAGLARGAAAQASDPLSAAVYTEIADDHEATVARLNAKTARPDPRDRRYSLTGKGEQVAS